MNLDNPTLHTLRTAIIQLSNKQQVISSNIANLDTPMYKAKTTNFDKMMDIELKRENFKYEKNFMQTDDMHFSLKDDFDMENSQFEILQKNNYLIQNDENDVDLDIENMEMSKTNLLLKAAISSYQKSTGEFKKMLDSYNKLN
jgi:flagellar basal-body rod protein FlgB